MVTTSTLVLALLVTVLLEVLLMLGSMYYMSRVIIENYFRHRTEFMRDMERFRVEEDPKFTP